MGFVIRAFLTGVVVCLGLTVGDIVSKEIKGRYDGYKNKGDDVEEDVVIEVKDE